MKCSSARVLAALVVLCPVTAFNAGLPVGSNSRRAVYQQRRWIHMSNRASDTAATSPTRNRYIRVDFVQETPGGYISVVEAKGLKGAVTEHRVVVGKDQVESFSEQAGRDVSVEELVSYAIKYMMDKGMSLENTEGMIDASVFPVNYFTLRQLTYFHDDVDEKIAMLCKEAPQLSDW